MNISDNEERFSISSVLPTLWGAGAGIAASCVLLFAVGAAVYSTADPNSCLPAASAAILSLSSLTAGIAGAKIGGGFVHGAAAGALFALIVFVSALASGGEGALPPPYSYLVRAAALGISLLGAYLVSRRAGRRRIGAAPKRPKIKR